MNNMKSEVNCNEEVREEEKRNNHELMRVRGVHRVCKVEKENPQRCSNVMNCNEMTMLKLAGQREVKPFCEKITQLDSVAFLST